ncbi:hypothetical protein [Priestia megaterium]|uniref:hypothetical protein n=1 Tax=Priestia megaterium TaxID=1404 RepID=UPI001A95145B|nr:hypothetical protein [Priestia megaterium]QSX23447.1 hypothetical protein J0P05_27100 [Priestia megaterium]
MNIILVTASICFFIIAILNLYQYRTLEEELGYLPKEEINLQVKHPLVGENIETIMPHNWSLPSRRLIIQVSLTSCSSCHSALEQLLKNKNRYNAEYYVMSVAYGNRAEEKKKMEEFIDNYKNLVGILPYSQEFLEKADISQYPTFLFINQDGIIEMITSLAGKLDSFLTK